MSAHEFTIPVADLDAGGKHFHFTIRPGWIRGVLEGHEATAATADGALDLRASKSGHDVIVHGKLDAALNVPCARCLEPFPLSIHSDVSAIYVPRAKLKEEAGGDIDAEIAAAEADTLPFDGDTLVLDDLVRDELVLEVPMIPLCSEACPGISPPPGFSDKGDTSEKDIDPRLAPLLRFKDKDKKE